MQDTAYRAIAIVGVGAVLPDAPNAPIFWSNVKNGVYSISDVSPNRWDPELYYNPDPKVPDKTYSKIGGWVKNAAWDPVRWHLPIPPKVSQSIDDSQKWAIACTVEALNDYGFPSRPLDLERTAVIFGNAMAGELHYLTAYRLTYEEYVRQLKSSPSFSSLPKNQQQEILVDLYHRINKTYPEITEDTMPGELSNCIAGRVANLFNFHGPNYVCDAACASAMAAISSAIEGLVENDFDTVITGGIDRNMGVNSFIKFSKIGALSATGTRPYADGADGFVMGEGAVVFILKRLADAERDGDKIYAVIRGVGGASDGKGKGITAPNPIGQQLAIKRAWANATLPMTSVSLIEGHGTSTRVGDVVEVQSLTEAFGDSSKVGTVALGSVKSNIGHLKAAAGAAGLLKAAYALHEKALPPSLNFVKPNPNIDFAHSPFFVNSELRDWKTPECGIRRAGVSAFGFGGTNFHIVLEEYIPGHLKAKSPMVTAIEVSPTVKEQTLSVTNGMSPQLKTPLRGALVVGAENARELTEKIKTVYKEVKAGKSFLLELPKQIDLQSMERIAIDYSDSNDLAEKLTKTVKALDANNPAMWKALRAQGVFRGRGAKPKVAFLYTGQGSQYVNMLKQLKETEPIVADVLQEADKVMSQFLDKPLSEYLFVKGEDEAAVNKAEKDLRQTAITQPAILSVDIALTKLLAAYGIRPDMVMGHSLGEYGALVTAQVMPFSDALEAVSARGREMTKVSVADNGKMAAIFAPIQEIEKKLKTIDGYVVIANINSNSQSVIGGASDAVEKAVAAFKEAGFNTALLPVSHAFHTSIVAPASKPLYEVLSRLHIQEPKLPIIANVTGDFYPSNNGSVGEILDILSKQVASPVQFVKGLKTLYNAGVRLFVEVGPKKALQGFVDDLFGNQADVFSLFTNHPKLGDLVSFNQALCGLYAAGLGSALAQETAFKPNQTERPISANLPTTMNDTVSKLDNKNYLELGQLFAQFLEKATKIYNPQRPATESKSIVISGAGLGLPGTEYIFDNFNLGRILRGEQFIDVIPGKFRRLMLDKHITRLVKSDSGARFETIDSVADVIKLAARGGKLDLEHQFGIPAERIPALDRFTQLAIGVGLEALRDAGIPLVMHYKTTTKGTYLPDRWGLPSDLQDSTGVIFASAFPGLDSFAENLENYYEDHSRHELLDRLENLHKKFNSAGNELLLREIEQQISEVKAAIESHAYTFDRRFIFRILSMGHSQFAELIGARGPNTHINSACASTTQALSLAEDWIKAGRCRRVVIVAADDVTSDNLLEWIGSGFLASGAAATDEDVKTAALPFDRRRHGMILGMGAAGIVVESLDSIQERGLMPICEVLSTVTANSAFHGTRLDVKHICTVMEKLVSKAENAFGFNRSEIASQLVFVSHETYTPARGGSASAEVNALRTIFGEDAKKIVIANTKGFTGHAMGACIEDVIAIKALETGIVPPVANFKEEDPDLGHLNLSKGGAYPVNYALRLGAGFGSQISMSLIRFVPPADGKRRSPESLGYDYRIYDQSRWNNWLAENSGYNSAEVETVHRTLRIKDCGAPTLAKVVTKEKVLAQTPAISIQESVKPAPIEETKTPIVTSTQTKETLEVVQKEDVVKEKVLSVVAEKTGYPSDMLDLELDLEADLGIDTVKQAEVFAAIRESFNIPRQENLKLKDFPTLKRVMQFVYDHRPDLSVATSSSPINTQTAIVKEPAVVAQVESQVENVAQSSSSEDFVKVDVLKLVSEKTGYPQDMLDVELDLEADLGVDTVKQAELFATVREHYHIPRDENRKLKDFPTLGHVIKFVYDQRPDLKQSASPTKVQEVKEITSTELVNESSTEDKVQVAVLNLVAEKTGYPQDMLDLDLDLEADLGVDTVKQAELFAAVRGLYNIPRDENRKLKDFPTLRHVIKFVYDQCPNLNSSSTSIPSPTISEAIASEKEKVSALEQNIYTIEQANQAPRRLPIPLLRPALDYCKPTEVELKEGFRVLIMPDTNGVSSALTENLQQKGVIVLTLDPKADQETITATIKEYLAQGAIQGVFWLPALDYEGQIKTMSANDWQTAINLRIKLLYTTMRELYEFIKDKGTFLVSAVRLGGHHGYDKAGAYAPMGGAVVGFTKSFKQEHKEALVKVVDFEQVAEDKHIADLLIKEVEFDPGVVEIGYKNSLRWTIGLKEFPISNDAKEVMHLNKDSVFVITGAAGSIVSAITADLANHSKGIFYLLDLTPVPDENDTKVIRFLTDKENLKREIYEELKSHGDRATPATVEKELAKLERLNAALQAIKTVEAAGGQVYYHSVNLTDYEAVARVIKEIRQKHGYIDVLVHAAGLEISHFLADKEPSEFNLVFGVKSDGWYNLLHSIGDMPLKSTVVFSSIAGRFGNGGQTDYSAANDLLCKYTSSLRGTHPDTRAIAIDWTAWGGIGMATRGSIPKMMELAGIDMLAPEIAIPTTRREITLASVASEVVVAKALGILMNEWDQTGGLDTNKTLAQNYLMIDTITGMGLYSSLTATVRLDPTIQPFLIDHKMDGTAILPGVMGIEAFAEISTLLLPDWHISAIEDVNFLAPFKFYRDEPRTLTLQVDFISDNCVILAECKLLGTRQLANHDLLQTTLHFTACVKLSPSAVELAKLQVPSTDSLPSIKSENIYQVYFHGAAYQVLSKVCKDNGQVIGLMNPALPPNHVPENVLTIAEPRLIELCFQTAGVWEITSSAVMGLPAHIDQLILLPSKEMPQKEEFIALVSHRPDVNSYDAKVIDSQGNAYLSIVGYRTMVLPTQIEKQALDLLEAIN